MADTDNFDWGDDPFSGDIDFDTDFDKSAKHGFLRSVASGFLSGIVDNTVGSSDARIDTLKKALPNTWNSAFSIASDINRRRREVVEELKKQSHSAVVDLQYLAKRAGERLQKFTPNKIGSGLIGFSQNDFSDWEGSSSSSGERLPGMEDASEDEVEGLLDERAADALLQREATAEAAQSTVDMLAEVGGRQLGGLNLLNMSINRTNQLVEQTLHYQQTVQRRNDALQLNIAARQYLVSSKYYKFQEAAQHRVIGELRKIAESSAKSDYEKTSHSQAMRKSIREGVFNTVKGQFGGIREYLTERFGKDARGDAISDASGLIGAMRMAAEMTQGQPMNYGDMLGKAAASIFIANVPRMAKSKKGKEYLKRFTDKFPEQAQWATDAYERLRDLGNVASYNLGNMEGMVNTMADFYQGDFGLNEVDYDEYVASLPADQTPMGKIEWTLLTNAKKAANAGTGAVLGEMYRSTGTTYHLKRRTLADGWEVTPWNKRSDRTLNETIPEWLSHIHLSIEKLRTGKDDLEASRYDHVRGKLVSHDQAMADTFNRTIDGSTFRSQADSALRMVDKLDTKGELSAEARQELAMQFIDHSDKKKGISPYSYMDLERKGASKENAEAIRKVFQRQFDITDDDYVQFVQGTDVDRARRLAYLPSEEARKKAADLVDDANLLSRFGQDMSTNLDNLRGSGYYDLMVKAGLIKSENGNDSGNAELFRSVLREFVADPDKKTARVNPTPSAPLPTRGNPFAPPTPPTPTPAPAPIPPAPVPRLEPTEFERTSWETLFKVLDAIKENTGRTQGGNPVPPSMSVDFSPLMDRYNELAGESNKHLLDLVAQGGLRNEILTKLLDGQVRYFAERKEATKEKKEGSASPSDVDPEVEEQKRSLLDRLKETSFKDMFNKGMDKLLDHQPLVLGGLLGGIAGMAIYNPKAAALVGGGFAAATLYGKLRGMAVAREAEDSQDLYEEGSTIPLLEAFKLKNGEYWDVLSERVIRSWQEIKGSVKDMATGAVIGAKRLAGKLFTQDNKEVFIKGLSKLREALIKTFKWIDPIGRLSAAGNKLSTRFYQMDVYREGDKDPVLLGSRFGKGEYFGRDAEGNFVQLNGWNEIKGAVYDRQGNMLITEEDFERGLKTSMGTSITKLGSAVGKAKDWGLDLLGKLKEKASPAARAAADKTKAAFTADYSPIVSSVDRIYELLLKHWGYGDPVFENNPFTPPNPAAAPRNEEEHLQDIQNKGAAKEEAANKLNLDEQLSAKRPDLGRRLKEQREAFEKKLKEKEEQTKRTPEGDAARLNSLADQAQQKREEKNNRVKDAIISIAENFGFGKTDDELKKENRGGLFGLLGGIRAGFGKLKDWLTGGFIAKGFQTLFSFATAGLKWLPMIGTGVLAVGKGLMTLLRTRSIGSAAGDFMDTIRRRRGGGGNPPRPGNRFLRGAKVAGAGMAVAAGASALTDWGIIDPDSGMGTALNVAGTAASVVGGVQMTAATLSALGMTGLSTALGAAGSTVLSGLTAAGTAGAALLFNPITLGIGAAGLAAYGIYKLATWNKGRQLEIRMTQYGLSKPDGELCDKILKAEAVLTEYVVIGNGRASLSKSAPLEQVLQLFTVNPKDREEIGEVFTWFNGRFKPVFMTYMACLDVVKMKTLKEYDESSDQKVYQVAKQAHAAISALMPYPYAVVANIDKDNPLLDEKVTVIRVNNLLEQLKKYVSADDVTKGGKNLFAVETPVGQSAETLIREQKALETKLQNPDTKWKDMGAKYKAENRLKEVSAEINRLNTAYKAGSAVSLVFIKDLMPDGKAMDVLTAIRVAAYGNEDDIPWRVEAVLKLERYCEPLFTAEGDRMKFTGDIGELFTRFKDAFRVGDGMAENWCRWCRDRFLPVLTNYMTLIRQYRRGLPGAVWKTLSTTARYEIAKGLVETQAAITSAFVVPIWNVRASPFADSKSPGKPDKVDRLLNILGEAATESRLRDPEKEAGKTSAQNWAKTISPHKVGGDFTEKQPNVELPDKYRNRRDQATGGQYGTMGGNPGTLRNSEGAYTTPPNQYGYKPVSGDTDTSHLDMTGLKTNDGNDNGVTVPKQLAEQLVIREMLKQGFTDPRQIAEMLALTNYETGGYSKTTENMKYSSPEQLVKLFKEVTNISQARELVNAGEVAIANTVYGGDKGRSIGNTQPGDGWKYRGRGFVQLTGRENYRNIGNQLGIDLENKPELASTDPNVMAAIAVNFFKNSKQMQSISQDGDFGKAAVGLNGGKPLPGMDKRYSLYLSYLKQLESGQLQANDRNITDNVGSQTGTDLYGTSGGSGAGTPMGTPGFAGPTMGGNNGSGVSAYGTQPGINPPSTGDGTDFISNTGSAGSGLRLKSDETVAGGGHHPGLDKLMRVIQSRVPGFVYFSAINDAYHVDRGSKGGHPKGLACDFTLTNGVAGSDRACSIVTEILRSAGMAPNEFLVLNEYRRKTALGTGGHVHVGFKSNAAADKYFNAMGGNEQGNGQDTTDAGGGPVQARPTPPPQAPEAPAVPELILPQPVNPIGNVPQEAPNPQRSRYAPLQPSLNQVKQQFQDDISEKGEPDNDRVVEPSRSPTRSVPNTPTTLVRSAEEIKEDQRRFEVQQQLEAEKMSQLLELAKVVAGMGSQGADTNKLLAGILQQITAMNQASSQRPGPEGLVDMR